MAGSFSALRVGFRIVLASSIALLLTGCVGTTGRGWVAESHYDQAGINPSLQPRYASIPASTDPEPQPDARPRLNHTVTLGEIDVAPSAADVGPGSAGSPLTINNYNVMNVTTPAYGYAGIGYGRAVPSFATGRAARAGVPAITPGQSWPTIAEHGPSFPYSAGPASAWSRPQ